MYVDRNVELLVAKDRTPNNASFDESSNLPPSYESIFGQFKENKDGSDSSLAYFKKAAMMFAGTAGCTFSLMLLLALPMSMIIIGSKYKDDCPVEPFIPIYLIVGGSFGILKTVIIILQRIIYNEDIFSSEPKENHVDERPIAWMFLDGVLNIFLFTWFIAGNIWVYSKYKPHFVPPPHEPLNYCSKTLYLFAFWIITVCYLVMAMICFCTCCLGVCASCTAYFVTSSNTQTQQDE